MGRIRRRHGGLQGRRGGATDAELREWVKQRLRSSRVPTAIRHADQLPYNEMGKVLRRVIKQQFADAG